MFSHASAASHSPVACARRREPPTVSVDARDSNSLAFSHPRPHAARRLGCAHRATTSRDTRRASSSSRPGSITVAYARAYSAVSSSMGGHACLHTELINPKTGQHVATSLSNVCTFYPMYVPIILAIDQGNQRGRQTQTAARPNGDVTHVHARWMGHARPRMGYHYICQQFSCDVRTSRTARARTLDAS